MASGGPVCAALQLIIMSGHAPLLLAAVITDDKADYAFGLNI